ncbi:hypothetical protein [Bdellovibrio reynosensis]|uniref:Peptidase M30 n=1 Tax=Bdellovibrio reynosensis TaxID=2835041 RepID=A0ABY4C8N8_9BACT|nr:hypothetical protein [Bdellovibrio reynosensis]UOF01358.1 hypothetical protein MNR06_00120 [Bdellovibrio reynosensis]
MRFVLLIAAALITVVTFQNCAGQNPADLGVSHDHDEAEAELASLEEEVAFDEAMSMKATTVTPQKPACIVLKSSYVAKLTKMYELQGVRVFYSTDAANPDAVKYLADKNKNKHPDYVEDIARQIVAARAGLNELGFMDPVQSPRYKAYGVQYIDVHVRNLSGNGLAYDEATVYSNNPLKKNACTLRIDLSNKLEAFPGGWTVGAHELFHLYEYGYTMFKRSWFLEGMAAWGERVVRLGALRSNGLTPLPATARQLQEEVFAVNYNFMWDRLAYLSESNKNVQFSLSTNLQKATYIDGSNVYRDQKLLGIALMKSIMRNLAKESTAISAEKGWSNFFWAEADQKDPVHDKRMIRAVQRAIKEMNLDRANTSEISAFLKL